MQVLSAVHCYSCLHPMQVHCIRMGPGKIEWSICGQGIINGIL
jgi:hypothetical protein